MSNTSLNAFSTAVVVGASIGGSAVAASLAPHFDRVIVIERDELPDEPAKRKGVPHSYQFHTLTVGGRLVLEDIFPGLTEDLHAGGAPTPVLVQDSRYKSKAGWFPRVPTEHVMLAVTRRYLEFYIRGRAAKLSSVEFVDSTQAVGLVVADGRTTGLRIRNLTTGQESVIEADLVVDTGGRPSQAPQWLEEAGYEKPKETVINARWGYATTYVEVPEDWHPDWHSTYIGPTVSGEGPAATRGGAMWRQEGNRYVITAQGCAGDFPPQDIEGFKKYISSFGFSEFADMIDQFGVAEPVEAWRNTSNRLRDFAGLNERPAGFVVVGDACAAFNPIYGQGMSMAAFAAQRLGKAVAAQAEAGNDLDGHFTSEFQRAYQDFLAPYWEFSTSSDYTIPGVEVDGVPIEVSERPESQYAARVIALATEDADIAIKFMETVSMLRDTSWLAEPSLVERVQADWDRLGLVGQH